MSCFKQSKFQQKIHSLWKMWMLNIKQKVSTDAEDSQVFLWYCIVYHLQIGLFYLFWSCELRTNIDCTTKLKALYETSTTHLCMTSHLSEVLRTKCFGDECFPKWHFEKCVNHAVPAFISKDLLAMQSSVIVTAVCRVLRHLTTQLTQLKLCGQLHVYRASLWARILGLWKQIALQYYYY